MGMNFSRPFGTWLIRALLPTLKRWAIVVQSLRDGIRDVYPIGYNQASLKPMPRWFRHSVVTLSSRTPPGATWRLFEANRTGIGTASEDRRRQGEDGGALEGGDRDDDGLDCATVADGCPHTVANCLKK